MIYMPLDWIAAAFELSGAWLLGDKNRWSFILFLACNACWIAYVFRTKTTYGLLLVVLPMSIINIRNWIKWKPKPEAVQ